jgi:hypothetical protein
MIFVVPAKKADKALGLLAKHKATKDQAQKHKAWIIGEVIAQRRGKPRVEYR